MEFKREFTSLSIWVHLWLGLICVLWFLSFIWLWQFSLCCLLFAIPLIFYIRWWYNYRYQLTLNDVLKPFLHGFINITIIAVMVQCIGIFILWILFYVTHAMYFAFGRLCFILICIVFYVSIEEMLKLFFSLKSRDCVQDPLNQITKIHTITSTGTSLGYSCCSGILWTALSAHILNVNNSHSLMFWLFLITCIIAVVGMPTHLITGYLTGCQITKRDIDNNNNNNNERPSFRSYINIIYISIFVRSAYTFFIVVGFFILEYSITGVIIAVLGILIDYFLLIKYVRNIEKELPLNYLQRAGHLNIFGYNVLGSLGDQSEDEDEDEDEDDNANSNNNQFTINDDDDKSQNKINRKDFGFSPDLITRQIESEDVEIEIEELEIKSEKVDIDVEDNGLDQVHLTDNDSTAESMSQSTIR